MKILAAFLLLIVTISQPVLARDWRNFHISLVNETTQKPLFYTGQTVRVHILNNGQVKPEKPAVGYIWYLDGREISRTDSPDLLLKPEFAGHRISVGVGFPDPQTEGGVKEYRSHREIVYANSAPRVLLGIRPGVNGIYTSSKVLEQGDLLTVDYHYFDYESDQQGASRYVFRTDNKVLQDGNKNSYRVSRSDLGSRLWVEVTPVAKTGVITGKTSRYYFSHN